VRGTFFQDCAESFAPLRGPASLGSDDGVRRTLLRPAVGFIVGLHLSGLGERKHWSTPCSDWLGSRPLCSE